ncbi:MAG: SPOR domain-containing protein [Desulforegulaceae bacterium]|nr:SPOR domain-containing protein [Desulforegulaceae bacterium]
MTRIPEVYSKTLYRPPKKESKPGSSGFEVEMADKLLQTTKQYESWVKLRQKNDNGVKEAAELILKRHELIKNLKKGEKTDKKLFDDLTEKISRFGIKLFSFSDLGKKGFLPQSEIDEPSKAEFSKKFENIESDEFIFELRHKNRVLYDGIFSIKEKDEFYYPVKPLLNIFKYDYQLKDNILEINENNRNINFDFNSLSVLEDKNITKISEKDFLIKNNEIFLSKKILSKLFKSEFVPDFSKMVLFVESKDLIFEEEVYKTRGRVYTDIDKTSGFKKLDQKYSMLDFPAVDFQGNLRHDSKEKDDLLFDYSLNARGEILKSGYRLFVKGSEDENPDRTDILLERINPLKSSPFEITRAAALDVKHDNFKMLGSSDTESGIRIESYDLQKNRDFDTKDFEGNLPPDTEIELYRNNVLIGRKKSGLDGKYLFDDIPVFYGQNIFKLVWQDQQGQKIVEEEIVNIGSDMVKKGSVEYDLTISSKDKDTITFKDQVKDEDYNSSRLTGNISFGAFTNFNVDAGLRSEQIESKRYNYLGTGFKTSLSGVLLNGDAVFDGSGNSAQSLLIQTRLNNLGLRFKNTYFDDLERDNMGSNPDKNLTEFSISGTALENTKLPVSFSINEKYSKGQKKDTNILTTSVGLVKNKKSLFNYNIWQKNNYLSTNDVNGYIYGYADLENYDLKIQGDYSLYPSLKLDSLLFSADKTFDENISAGIEFQNDFKDDVFKTETSLHFDSGKFRISPSFSADTDGEWQVRTDIAFSVSREPHLKEIEFDSDMQTDYGKISALLYEDKNNNKKKDDSEEVLKDLSVSSVTSGQKTLSNENGTAVLKGFSPYKKTGISVDLSSAKDPFLESEVNGVVLYPRPGKIEKIEIPFYRAGEILGYLYFKNENSEIKPLAYEKMVLESLDGEIKNEIMSDYDGYFVAEKIIPGKYNLKVSKNGCEFCEEIQIESSSSITKNIVISSHKKINQDKGLKKSDSKVLYENGKWSDENKDEVKKVDKSILLYENGNWVYGTGKIKGFGVHIASFKNFDYAKKLVEKISNEYGHGFIIKQFEHNGQLWHRVMSSGFDSRKKAGEKISELQKITGYASVLQL